MESFDDAVETRLEIRVSSSEQVDQPVELKQMVLIGALEDPLLIATDFRGHHLGATLTQ